MPCLSVAGVEKGVFSDGSQLLAFFLGQAVQACLLRPVDRHGAADNGSPLDLILGRHPEYLDLFLRGRRNRGSGGFGLTGRIVSRLFLVESKQFTEEFSEAHIALPKFPVGR